MDEEKRDTPEENKKGQLESLKNQLRDTISEEGGEKLKFLKREEIRTMKKDIERLREIEAEKERERIMALEVKKEEEKKPSVAKAMEGKAKATKEAEEEKKEPSIDKAKKDKEEREKIIAMESEIERVEPEKPELEKEPEIKKEEKPELEKEPEIKKEEKPELEKEIQLEETLIPKPPKRPSSFRKILVRIGFILFFIFLLISLYWFSTSGRIILEDILVDFFTTTEELLPKPKKKEELEIIVPSSFIPVKEVLTFEISKNNEMPSIIEGLTVTRLTESDFTRVIIKDKEKNRLVDLKDVTQAFQLETVPEVIEKLDVDNFNFLVYPQKEGRREVFIVKIKEKENLSESLAAWETKIIQQGLFIAGNKVSTIAPSFKTFTSDDGSSIRYLTISKNDLGVCYTLFENYFILSSSFESIEKTLRVLKTSPISSLEQDLGQLFIVGFEGKTITPQLESFFKKYKPGGVLLLSKNIENEQQLKSLTEDLQSLSQRETGFPLFIAVDQEGGLISRIEFLEEKTAQSKIETTDEAYGIGFKRGKELKELGVNINLAPLLDDMESDNFYFNRSFQKSPSLSGELAKSLISGQKQAGILTTIKHFPGYVGIPFNPETKLATILTPEISQFKKAMESEPELIMVSNAIYTDTDPSLPLTFSEKGIQYLKNNLGSEILVISDDLAQTSLLDRFSLKEIMTKPIEVGVDILIFSGWVAPIDQALDNFLEAVSNKEVSETKIEKAIARIIKLKQSLP